jgi:hypothetical protein
MTINLQPHERELVELTLADLCHIAKETAPECDDHQLRRVSVQLRNLLIEDCFVRSWKLLQLQPKSPTVIAPRLRTDGLGPNDFAVAGGGDLGGVSIAKFRYMPGRALSAEEMKANYEREKKDFEYPFSVSEYKDSCAVYVGGQKISRKQLVQYVANKKGGAHLDNSRKKDEQAYSALDAALKTSLVFGARHGADGKLDLPGKNAVYLELLSIGQYLTSSPDSKRFVESAQSLLQLK